MRLTAWFSNWFVHFRSNWLIKPVLKKYFTPQALSTCSLELSSWKVKIDVFKCSLESIHLRFQYPQAISFSRTLGFFKTYPEMSHFKWLIWTQKAIILITGQIMYKVINYDFLIVWKIHILFFTGSELIKFKPFNKLLAFIFIWICLVGQKFQNFYWTVLRV